MRNLLIVGTMALAAGGVHAQTPQAQPDTKQTVTVTGCVQNESDVLKRPAAAGKIGMSDEFVLTGSMIQTGASATEPATSAKPATPSGGIGKVYRVTGDQEASLKAHLGHKVEISGTFKSETDASRELSAIGTSGRPPETPAAPTPENSPEITIRSIRVVADTCGG